MDTKMINASKKKCLATELFYQLSKMWVLPILVQIINGEKYFSGIKNKLDGISSRTLSQRLKDLQEYGFIMREIVSEQPVRIEYSLTEKGKCFSKELYRLSEWARKW